MTTLYERMGGKDGVAAAVEAFYRKVLADPRTRPFFGGIDLGRQIGKLKALLTMAFGGPASGGADLRAAHADLVARGLDDSHVDAVVEHLGATLAELGLPDELISAAAAIAESVRDDVLGRPAGRASA